jgi:hypothetical protein
MRQAAFLTLLCIGISGCVGTKITGREVDTTKPYPSLHSVPDKPTPIDFTKIDAERTDFDKSIVTEVHKNEELRKKFVPPVKKEPEPPEEPK